MNPARVSMAILLFSALAPFGNADDVLARIIHDEPNKNGLHCV